jgi:hypothetical protein
MSRSRGRSDPGAVEVGHTMKFLPGAYADLLGVLHPRYDVLKLDYFAAAQASLEKTLCPPASVAVTT